MKNVKIGFSKFDGSDFVGWKHKMMGVLELKDLRDTVLGISTGEKQKQKAAAAISLARNGDQFVCVRDFLTATEAKKSVVKVYDSPSTASKLYLLRKLLYSRL